MYEQIGWVFSGLLFIFLFNKFGFILEFFYDIDFVFDFILVVLLFILPELNTKHHTRIKFDLNVKPSCSLWAYTGTAHGQVEWPAARWIR